MFIVQLAAAIGIFAILMGFGAEKALQYTQSRLPYNTAQRVVQATNFVGNAANSYYNQFCTGGSCVTTGLNYPRVQDLVAAGYLPSGQGYSSCNCYRTKDGSTITLNPGSGASGMFGMSISPGPILSSKPAYASMVASRIPGSVLSGNTINVSQPVPALANIAGSLASKYVQVNPSGQQSGDASLSGNFSSGSISTPGPINSSNAVTATGDTTLWHGVIWTWWDPPIYGASGNAFGTIGWGWWPAPSYWWRNTPGYSGCGGQNPSGGVNMPWGTYQVWQTGSCTTWVHQVPGGPYGY